LTGRSRKAALAAFVCSVVILSIAVYTISTPRAAAGHSVKATLIIDFSTSHPRSFYGYSVTWSFSDGRWGFTERASNDTVYVFENVTAGIPDVWALMNESSKIMLSTTGYGLMIEKTYYPEYSDYFITAIGGVSNSNALGLYWQYEVNGSLALYGVLHETIHQGSIVEWFFGSYSGQ
jgi:hypothetical protein